MVTEPDPAAQKFGAEVRRLREQAGLSQTKLARQVPASQAAISDLELGKARAKKGIAERIDQILTSDGRVVAAWEAQYESYEPPDWYRKLPAMERRATQIHEYQPLLIPGLLQTEDYARASIRSSNRSAFPDEVDAKVAERTERQAILRSSNAPFLLAVLDETVLYRRLGTPAVMEQQLDHLREVSTWDRVEVLVVPGDTWNHPGLDNGFKLMRVPDAGMLLYQETRAGGGVVIDVGTVDEHVSLLGDLRGLALPPNQSRALIEKAQGEVE